MINELGGPPSRSENVYFASNEQASIADFTVAFCFAYESKKFLSCLM